MQNCSLLREMTDGVFVAHTGPQRSRHSRIRRRSLILLGVGHLEIAIGELPEGVRPLAIYARFAWSRHCGPCGAQRDLRRDRPAAGRTELTSVPVDRNLQRRALRLPERR